MSRRMAWVALLLLVVAASHARAATDTRHDDPKRGYWWYERPPQEEKKKDREKPAIPDYTVDEMMNMDPDRLREYAEQVLKEAVRVPTEKNVRRHYLVQDVIRRKALAFVNTSEMVWQKYPELTTAKDNPLTTPGRKALTRAQVEERRRKLMKAKDEFALLYFRSDSCPFCQAQDAIMPHFVSRVGWQVKPINIEDNPDLAARLGVETTPSLILIRRGSDDFFPVTTGVASVMEIEKHLFRAIRLMRGEVTPENFNLYDFQRGGGYDVQARR